MYKDHNWTHYFSYGQIERNNYFLCFICNSPVSTDLELFFCLAGLHLWLLFSYCYLLHHLPVLTHSLNVFLNGPLSSPQNSTFRNLGFFFILSRFILILNLSFRVLAHFSASCHLQIYMYFQFINSPEKIPNQWGQGKFLPDSIFFSMTKIHWYTLSTQFKCIFFQLPVAARLFTTLAVILFSILDIDCFVSYASLRDSGEETELTSDFFAKQVDLQQEERSCTSSLKQIHHNNEQRKGHHWHLKGHSSPMRSLFFAWKH